MTMEQLHKAFNRDAQQRGVREPLGAIGAALSCC
jgi:hypothetical protein